MSVHSIFGRTVLLSRADVETLLDRADEPRALLDRMVRDYTGTIGDAERVVALAVGALRAIEADAREVQAAAGRWAASARAASGLAERLRGSGDPAGADTLDDLARFALARQIDAERTARALADTIADEHALAERLTEGLTLLGTRLDALRRRRAALPATAGTTTAGTATAGEPGPDILDPAGDVAAFEERMRRELVRLGDSAPPSGDGTGDGTRLSAQVRVDVPTPHAEVEARLSRLKTAG